MGGANGHTIQPVTVSCELSAVSYASNLSDCN